MPEEFLDVGDGSTAFEEMGRKRMPQRVRADANAEAATGLPDDDADRLATEVSPTAGQEQSPAVSPLGEDGPRAHQIRLQGITGPT